jgi:hypothetical protein
MRVSPVMAAVNRGVPIEELGPIVVDINRDVAMRSVEVGPDAWTHVVRRL